MPSTHVWCNFWPMRGYHWIAFMFALILLKTNAVVANRNWGWHSVLLQNSISTSPNLLLLGTNHATLNSDAESERLPSWSAPATARYGSVKVSGPIILLKTCWTQNTLS